MVQEQPTLPGMEGPPDRVAPGLSPTRRRTALRAQLLAAGIHPATRRPLADNGHTCGDCTHHRVHSQGRRQWHKCKLAGLSRSEATDIRVGWPACVLWRPEGW